MKSVKNVHMIGVFIFYVGVVYGSTNDELNGSIPPSTGGEYSLTRNTIDAGYAVLVGDSYRLSGIVGQAEPGIAEASSTVFVSGFISASAPLESSFIFEDGFEG